MESLTDESFAEGCDAPGDAGERAEPTRAAVPSYLLDHYWWAYVHPRAVRFFERQWLVDAILWGNYRRLRDLALDDLGSALPGRTLQVACAYGDFTHELSARAARGGGALDVIDALPIQIDNLRAKLAGGPPVRAQVMDAADMAFADASFDRAVLFFLLHEQPADFRRRTISETLRVVKPGGRIVIVDYAPPARFNPMRYLMRPVLARLEPFALDLWREDIAAFAPPAWSQAMRPQRYFGGLYQKVSLTR